MMVCQMVDRDFLTLFASSGQNVRCDLVMDVISNLIDMDPELKKSHEIWRGGKTISLQIEIGFVGDSNKIKGVIHVLIKNGGLRVVRSLLDSLKKRDVEFSSGRFLVDNVLPSCDHDTIIGQFVGGSVAITRHNDLPVIVIDEKIPTPVPETFAEGQLSGFPLLKREGGIAVNYNGVLYLLFFFKSPEKKEILAIKRGIIDVAILKLSIHLSVLAFGLRGFMLSHWSDLPFSIKIESTENQRLISPGKDGRMQVIVGLIDHNTNIVKAVRVGFMPKDWSAAFDDILADQLSSRDTYDMATYHSEVDFMQSVWRNMDVLPQNWLVICSRMGTYK